MSAGTIDAEVAAAARTDDETPGLLARLRGSGGDPGQRSWTARIGMAVLDNFTARSAVDEAVAFSPLQPTLAFDVFAMTLESRPFSHAATEFLDIFRACIDDA